MKNTLTAKNLLEFINEALFVNTAYFRERKLLWDKLVSYLEQGGEVSIPISLLISIKTTLCCRNDYLDDNKILSFNTAISKLNELIEPNLNKE